jgi:hypothetical protein
VPPVVELVGQVAEEERERRKKKRKGKKRVCICPMRRTIINSKAKKVTFRWKRGDEGEGLIFKRRSVYVGRKNK